MSLYLGNNLIAGSSDKIYNANNLLDFKWSDHLIDDMSWLRADTFSWQDGTVYNHVYSLFVTSIQDATEDTNQGVHFYKCENGLRIALANEEDNIVEEADVSKHPDDENTGYLIELLPEVPHPVTLSIYLEGWDRDNTDYTSEGVFSVSVHFKLYRQGDFR